MRKIATRLEALEMIGPLPGKTIVDVGCGTGDLVRELASLGVRAVGIDGDSMLAKATAIPRTGGETYLSGSATRLPLGDAVADVVTFFASLHHVPAEEMLEALRETRRILKPGGIAFFLEPVLRPGSYFELTGLIEDEREIQKLAYAALNGAPALGWRDAGETMVFFERSLDDFAELLKIFVGEETRRDALLAAARARTESLARTAGVALADFRFQSLCRANILEKAAG